MLIGAKHHNRGLEQGQVLGARPVTPTPLGLGVVPASIREEGQKLARRGQGSWSRRLSRDRVGPRWEGAGQGPLDALTSSERDLEESLASNAHEASFEAEEIFALVPLPQAGVSVDPTRRQIPLTTAVVGANAAGEVGEGEGRAAESDRAAVFGEESRLGAAALGVGGEGRFRSRVLEGQGRAGLSRGEEVPWTQLAEDGLGGVAILEIRGGVARAATGQDGDDKGERAGRAAARRAVAGQGIDSSRGRARQARDTGPRPPSDPQSGLARGPGVSS